MRRLFSLIVVGIILLVGCRQATDEAKKAGEFTTVASGKLTVASDIPFEPFEFEKDGALTGFDVELIREIAKRLDLEAEFVDTDFETIFTQVAAGRFDMVASATTITDERKKQVSFTKPYYLSQQALSINTTKTPNVKSVDDLKSGDTVAVQEGTTGKDWAEKNLGPKGVQVRSFPEGPDTYTALDAGQVAGVIFDEPSGIAESRKRPNLKVVQTIDTGERYGFGVNPQNAELLAAVDDALQKIIDDGTYDKIYAKYADLPPGGRITAKQG